MTKENKDNIVLQAEQRDICGKQVKHLRKDGLLPAVVYGYKQETTHITINSNEFLKLYRVVGQNHVLNIQIGKKKVPVLVHMYDEHPVTQSFLHVDFLAINMEEKVRADIPLKFTGESMAVKNKGAITFTQLHEVEVESLPKDLPDHITVDISTLEEVGDAICVRDLQVPKNVIMITAPEQSVVIAQIPRAAVEKEEEIEEEVEGGEEEGEKDSTKEKS